MKNPEKMVFEYARNGDAVNLERVLKKFPGLVNILDAEGRTPLIHAAMNKKMDCIPVLISHGAEHYFKDSFGMTSDDYMSSSPPYTNKSNPEAVTAVIAISKIDKSDFGEREIKSI